MDPDRAAGLPDDVSFGELIQHGMGRLVVEAAAEQWVPLRSEKRALQALQ
jgi:hypothetical protein